jgi:4-hydroxy-3-methylbut-2-enyl diphosphate reductase
MKQKKVLLAENSGFCFGVKRAVSQTYDILKKTDKKVYILGKIIHNPNVVRELNDLGAVTINKLEEITDNDAVLIIRCHGVPKHVIKKAEGIGLEVINTTCPFVKKIESYVEQLIKDDYEVVIIGDKKHPEVVSLVESFNNNIMTIEKAEQIDKIGLFNKLGIVVQTTQSKKNFKECILKLLDKSHNLKIYNTICEATSQRQKSTLEVAKKVDIMIVIGGKNSANTTRLYQISKDVVENVYHIETSDELKPEWFENKINIGVTAGASTPSWIIEDIIQKIYNIINGVD